MQFRQFPPQVDHLNIYIDQQGYSTPIAQPQQQVYQIPPQMRNSSSNLQSVIVNPQPQQIVLQQPQRVVQQQSPQPQYKPQVQQIIVPQPKVETLPIQQPIQVVDLFQVEEPWRRKVEALESELIQVRNQQSYIGNSQSQSFQETEKELSQAYAQIQQLINTIKILQEENTKQTSQLESKQRRIEELEKLLKEKDQQINDAQLTIEDLNNQLDDIQNNKEDKHTYLQSEVETWKQKFLQLNKEYHQTQESLILAQAELDNVKNNQAQMKMSYALRK